MGPPVPCHRDGMERRAYPSDLSDAEDACPAAHLPGPAPRGRPSRWPLREILDAAFSVVRTGCQWRHLPHEDPVGRRNVGRGTTAHVLPLYRCCAPEPAGRSVSAVEAGFRDGAIMVVSRGG